MTEAKKKEIIEKIVQEAVDAQLKVDSCAWSTLYGLSTYFAVPKEMVAASMALSGGGASSSGTCGALNSGLLVIGAKNFPPVEEQLNGDEKTQEKNGAAFAKAFRLRDAFLAEYGCLLCRDVHKRLYGRSFNLLDEKEREEFLNLPGHREKCAEVVAFATRKTAEILLEDE